VATAADSAPDPSRPVAEVEVHPIDRKRVTAAIALLVAVIVVVGWSKAPNTLWYKHGRPTRFGRVTNRTMSGLASLGIPVMVTLDVPARRSGLRRSTVLVPVQVDGDSYFVSMLGERSDWVQNVRAGTGPVYLRHGAAREVILEDVPAGQRARILKAYLHRAPGARPHFPLDKNAHTKEFDSVADRYPVFRVNLVDARDRAIPTRGPSRASLP
jgi:hypothetical protein